MGWVSDIRIRFKLVILLIITGAIPLLIIVFFVHGLITDALMEKSFNQLLTVQTIQKGQVEAYFENRYTGIGLLAKSKRVKEFTQMLSGGEGLLHEGASMTMGGADLDPYRRMLEEYVTAYGYSDIFLMDSDEGKVLFSGAGDDDFDNRLNYGKFQGTALAMVWQKAVNSGKRAVSDFDPFEPSGGQEALFVAQPIFGGDDDSVMKGVLVFQFGPDQVTHIVGTRKGMGETGECYLMGVEAGRSRYEFRSNLRTIGAGKFVVGYSPPVPVEYWQDALAASEEGGHATYMDIGGNPVLVAYNELNIPGVTWYLISKIDRFEVMAPIRRIYYIIAIVSGGLLLLIGIGAFFLSQSITRPLVKGMQFAQAISQGKLASTLDVDTRDELGDLARALNSMARNLQDLDWLKSGKEGLDDTLRGEHTSDTLAKQFVTFMARHMGAQLGAVYLLDGEVLSLKASYAFTNRDGNFNRIDLGEGMVGQSALENEILLFSGMKSDGPAINYGAGEMIPDHFMAAPISFEEKPVGVLLLGSVNPFTPLQRLFIEQNNENMAILFNAATSRQLIQSLLEKAQEQREALRVSNEELEEQAEALRASESALQVQQEELRVTNEELEEQATALRASESELQAQQEELRVTNEELEEQATALKESQSELQAQQEELRVINEELEERTKALEEQKEAVVTKNADLEEAQEVVKLKAHDLEIASKYKSEFLANMSHELRTPLNSILILSQLLAKNRDGNLTPKQVESAHAVHSSGADLLTLINEILDLSKIEAGKVELFIEEVALDGLTGDVRRLYKDMAEQKSIDFEICVDDTLPPFLRTDSQRLQQVLRNLLTNAFKFTQKGSVSLSILRPTPEMIRGSVLSLDTSIAFAVKDDGIGIPMEKQAVIFQAFQQADGGTSRKYGGTGLGLSISRELAKLLGGVISLVSSEGEGSTFTIVLPEVHESQVTESTPPIVVPAGEGPSDIRPPADPLPASSPTPVQIGEGHPKREDKGPMRRDTVDESEYVQDDRKRITPESKSLLIIEDDCNSAKIMVNFARERDFLCVVAEDGETGLCYADYYKPSAIILDIGLPGIDGWTVMERLKDNSELRHIPVHFMSANDSSLDALRMGAIGYLTKPVSLEKIDDAFTKLEDIIAKSVSRLLLVEDDKIHRDSIKALIGSGDVETTAVSTGREALIELEKGGYDCLVLDLGLEDMSGFDLLDKIRLSETAARVPIIIYTGRDLTREEESELNRYAESIIVKGVKSPERLLDESALFLHRVEANLPEEKRKMLKMVHDKGSVLSGKTILLVDDDMRNVFALSSILDECSIEVVIARNGIECLDKLKTMDHVDGILMDIMMPEMDGYEAMREIRKQKMFAKLPIIALTAKAMKGDRSKCIEAGASDYLAKPVNTERLLSMLRVWLY